MGVIFLVASGEGVLANDYFRMIPYAKLKSRYNIKEKNSFLNSLTLIISFIHKYVVPIL